MINENFIYLAVALILFGDTTYLIATIKGEVKPNKVTWFLWAFAPLIAYFAEISQKVGISSLMTFAVGALPLFIFLASFLNRNAYWKITKFDLICGLLSLLGLVLWGITRVGNLAILFAILADGLAALPTVVKSYKVPETESYIVFLFNVLGTFITILAIKKWDFAHLAFPLYMFVLCFILFLLIRFKIGKRIRF